VLFNLLCIHMGPFVVHCDAVLVGHCVSCPLCQLAIVSVGHCISWPLCQLAIVSVGHCISCPLISWSLWCMHRTGSRMRGLLKVLWRPRSRACTPGRLLHWSAERCVCCVCLCVCVLVFRCVYVCCVCLCVRMCASVCVLCCFCLHVHMPVCIIAFEVRALIPVRSLQ
jgi:hypothetical protein